MKNLRTLITICLLFTAVSMFAQTEGRLLVISQIPFDFTVPDHIMPAGEYLIYTATPDRSILISSAGGISTSRQPRASSAASWRTISGVA